MMAMAPVSGTALLCLFLVVAVRASSEPPPPPPALKASSLPNIVLVLVDEMGTGDVPWFDSSINAPTIAGLGEGGLRTLSWPRGV